LPDLDAAPFVKNQQVIQLYLEFSKNECNEKSSLQVEHLLLLKFMSRSKISTNAKNV